MECYLGFSIVGDTRRVSEIVSPLIRFCFSQSSKVNLFELTKDLVAIDSITGRFLEALDGWLLEIIRNICEEASRELAG